MYTLKYMLSKRILSKTRNDYLLKILIREYYVLFYIIQHKFVLERTQKTVEWVGTLWL